MPGTATAGKPAGGAAPARVSACSASPVVAMCLMKGRGLRPDAWWILGRRVRPFAKYFKLALFRNFVGIPALKI